MLLDPELHITATGRRVRRQRIIDNLLGTKHYCSMIRRTGKLIAAMGQQLGQEAKSIIDGADPSLLACAVHYLFTKETKSSFAIEGEVPSVDRTLRFVAALGRADDFNTGDKQAFVGLQNSIVDPRYAQKDWRTNQNYVGQTASNLTEIVHFICPKPEDVNDLMSGWMEMVSRVESGGVDPVCAGVVDSDTEEVSALLRFQNHSLDGVSGHSLDACQKLPLIWIWSELCINKNAVLVCSWNLLQRKSYQVANPPFGHGVLVGKQAVIRI